LKGSLSARRKDYLVTTDLQSRLQRLEDRAQISEQVIKYAMGVDRRDWDMFTDCFTDPVYADFSAGGMPARHYARDDFVAEVSFALNGFTATQHLSPNHVIEFDAIDPDRAICHSYMFAQHLLEGAEAGDYYLLHGSYTNHMCRTDTGWRIERIVQHRSWEYGNTNAVAEAVARSLPE
jgi:SnoaL-like domain